MSFYEDNDDNFDHDSNFDHDNYDHEDLDNDESIEINKSLKRTSDDVNEDDEELEDEYELDYDGDDIDDLDDLKEDDDDIDIDKNYIEDNINFIDTELDNESNIEYIVPANERLTSNTLTEFELRDLISVRAQQISQGSRLFVSNIDGLNNPIDIATKELLENRMPLYVKRYIGKVNSKKKIELWNPNEMNKPKN